MALSADTRPHFTTIADFVSSMETETLGLFRDVVLICDEMRLIGKDMFAIDGCKIPSNASKEWSGTKAEFKKKRQKMEQKIDSDRGRMIYSKRIGTVEPVFANLRHCLGLNRFTLRGDEKVNIQWKLFTIVDNLLKIHRFGPGFS